MPDLSTKLEQVRLFLEQHLPAEATANLVPVAVLVLIAGITMSVLGAKLARVALMLAFAGTGVLIGTRFAELSDYPTVICAIVGCAMVAAIGHFTFRLWVGAAVGAVLCLIALGGFGYDKLIPKINEYEQTRLLAVQGDTDGFTVPTAAEKASYITRTPSQLARGFWDFVTEQDSAVEKRAIAVGMAAMLIGLFLGVVAVRWAMVVATSLAGTTLVVGGLSALMTQFLPDSYRSLASSPVACGITIGGFFLTSVLLQGMLTRKSSSDNAASA